MTRCYVFLLYRYCIICIKVYDRSRTSWRQSLVRSRASGTSFPYSFLSSSTSNMVKSTPISILCHLHWNNYDRSRKSWRHIHLLGHARVLHKYSLITFELLELEYGDNQHQHQSCGICIERNTKGHGNRDVTVTVYVTREFYIVRFIIFSCSAASNMVKSTPRSSLHVASVLDEKRLVTEIVTSVTF